MGRSETDRQLDSWYEIERIPSPRVLPATKEILLEYVETPLQDAVGILYDKNIMTLGSSCNAANLADGFAWISLDWATLAEKNRKVVKAYSHHQLTTIENTDVEIAGLYFPIAANETPHTIGRLATALAKQFKPQPFSWAPRYTIDEAPRLLKEAHDAGVIHMTDGQISTFDEKMLIDLVESLDYPYQNGSFFMSSEHQQKYNDYPPEIN